jgi:2,5-diamino-6-(ribosylamino)-4(3H)-pyrimidinone 5'-phosphate reductase
MRPYVIVHVAVSSDGSSTGFAVDVGQYYRLASGFHEEATLTGSETLVAGPGSRPDRASAAPLPPVDPGDRRPWLVVTDGRGRVRNWGQMMSAGFWRGAICLCSQKTPRSALDRLRRRGVDIVQTAGGPRVDLRRALQILRGEYGVRRLRVDSGGALSGALLQDGLVDEISLVVHPAVASTRHPGLGLHGVRRALRLSNVRRLPGGLVWVRYRVLAGGRGRKT